jgi:hypothetical protein
MFGKQAHGCQTHIQHLLEIDLGDHDEGWEGLVGLEVWAVKEGGRLKMKTKILDVRDTLNIWGRNCMLWSDLIGWARANVRGRRWPTTEVTFFETSLLLARMFHMDVAPDITPLIMCWLGTYGPSAGVGRRRGDFRSTQDVRPNLGHILS